MLSNPERNTYTWGAGEQARKEVSLFPGHFDSKGLLTIHSEKVTSLVWTFPLLLFDKTLPGFSNGDFDD